MPYTKLHPSYQIPPVVNGCWQLAGGHGDVDRDELFRGMLHLVESGLNTFDCADIYTGVEDFLGSFRKYCTGQSAELASKIQVHTKFVPDFDTLSDLKASDVEKIIDRSRKRLGVERLDLVQFHWWNLNVPGYVEAALALDQLRERGKIRNVGLTNFDADTTREILEAGVPIVSTQVQYSLLDRRPEEKLIELAKQHNFRLVCYGSLAGGFLSEKYLGKEDPQTLENRSLVKYRLIIDEFGGWSAYQDLLSDLNSLSQTNGLSIAELAMLFPLQNERTAASIVGMRNSSHIESTLRLAKLSGDTNLLEEIRKLASKYVGVRGKVYELERDKSGTHGRIMKYNCNRE